MTRPPRLPRRARVLLPVLAAAAALCVLSCRKQADEDIETSQKVPVATSPARRGSIRGVIAATGTIRPAPGSEQLVMAPQAARIAEMPKAAGDTVHKGDLLVRFEIPSLNADAAARRADVDRAKARLANAQASEERISGLFERGIAARKEVEDARRELAEAQAAITESESGHAAAGQMAQRQTVRALFDGVVASRTHNPGDLVDAGSSDPILRVIDPRSLQVQVGVPVGAIGGIAVGSPARILSPGAGGPDDRSGRVALSATVMSLPAAVDPTTGTALVRLSLGAAASLPEGMTVDVEISGTEHRDAVVVPAAAIVREGTETYVFTIDAQSHAHRLSVKTGVASEDEVEVLSGMKGDEQVVVRGQQALPDGAEVSTEEPEGEAKPEGDAKPEGEAKPGDEAKPEGAGKAKGEGTAETPGKP